jgi:extracellular factor (EF) 3-hydroxypalmitic acid methyl ester biosynthesis protein
MNDFSTGYKILDRAAAEMKSDLGVLDRLCDDLTIYRSELGEQWPEFAKYYFGRHPIQQVLHESPFSRRAYEKPRGYPGDAVTIDYTYGLNSLDTASRFGRQLYEWEYSAACSQSVRSRRDRMARAMDDVALARPGARILSVACGHLREAQLSEAMRYGTLGEFIALDQDAASLAVVEAEHPRVRTVCAGVQSLVSGELKWSGLDFVYSAGLYDYLSDVFAGRLTERLFAMLSPGGKLLIANFHPDSPGSAAMEAWMDWWLIYRNEAQVEQLASRIDPTSVAACRSFRGEDRNVAYLELVKGEE